MNINKYIIRFLVLTAVCATLMRAGGNRVQAQTSGQSPDCGTICAPTGCYEPQCYVLGQYCLQPPASCPGSGQPVTEKVFQCIADTGPNNYPFRWQFIGEQTVSASCCATCGLPTPTPIPAASCATGAMQVSFLTDRPANPYESISCTVTQNNMNCTPCQGLLKTGSCTITSAAYPGGDSCSLAIFDARCGGFSYSCTYINSATSVQQTFSGTVPGASNNSTSVVNLTIPIPGAPTAVPTITPSACYTSCINSGKTPAECNTLCQPPATPTPRFTPTPTPLQVPGVITVAPTFSPIGNNRNPPPLMNAQRWACLNSAACSELLSLCRGAGNPAKRVRLSADNLLPSQDTYLFECLIDTVNGPLCTTGNTAVDTELLGTTLLPSLKQRFNYALIAIEDENGVAISPGTPVQTDSLGKLGPIEWESVTTDKRVGRMFLAMNALDPQQYQGNDPAQKQGLFELQVLPQAACLMLTWDPEGTVFDAETLEPVAGATVTLFSRAKNGSWRAVQSSQILGGIVNPQMTGADGTYAFRVPEGEYRLSVHAPGYRIKRFISDETQYEPYYNLYTGQSIWETGTMTHSDIPLERF